ncbi:alpha-1,3-mannosyl-glycoprotein 4-beta-N-acetylglucosaminyltransferase B isoform X2 [Cynoglossus semilaevis]|uniref:alpha-1,3-mannosyl-glycoprotein 4-beta-N-acetylglucosaminyltransferase B isoform X2 n=1 Tax=Cynoglossus semilaevis TaxID=244447 RepID=UPI000D628B72|nr:alpha-1,3-mannosyl-glycoprotein 4-beta-N-acetylglucosaminyltransferase A isoform X2 [Cynoglossus semilaevis]
MRWNSDRLRCLLLLCLCFLTATWIKSKRHDAGSALGLSWGATGAPGATALSDLQLLYQRLLAAEELGGQVSRNLSSILEHLRAQSKVSSTERSSTPTDKTQQPVIGGGDQAQQLHLDLSIYLHLPHLRHSPNSLVPKTVLGQGRRGGTEHLSTQEEEEAAAIDQKNGTLCVCGCGCVCVCVCLSVSVVLGVPTVKRDKQSYLINTINSLLYGLSSSQHQDLLIVVLVAEVDFQYVNAVAQTIGTNFPREVRSGLLEVISPPEEYYPDLSHLTETLGDSQDRVRWRTKQILDFSFLMMYSKDRGAYYVQLEDDIVAKEDYYQQMKTYVTQEASKPWLYLEFSQLGFIGKLFRTRDLPVIVDFFLMFHKDKPIDWLLDYMLWVKVCHPEKDVAHCDQQRAQLRQRYKPSLFQHMGLHSSLSGKVQHLKDKDFGTQVLYHPHSNPAAELETSLKHYRGHSLDRAYRGQDFFWAQTPNQGDYVLIRFPKPLHVSRFLFRSGNIENSKDKLYNTTVEVLPSTVSTGHTESDGFRVVGAFEDGLAAGQIENGLQPIWALRLVVHASSDVWTLLSEIHIEV